MHGAGEPLDITHRNRSVEPQASAERLALLGRLVHAHQDARTTRGKINQKVDDGRDQNEDDKTLNGALNHQAKHGSV
jgi:hypothetical protein